MEENDKPRKGQRHEKNQRLEAVIGDRAILFQEFSGGAALKTGNLTLSVDVSGAKPKGQ